MPGQPGPSSRARAWQGPAALARMRRGEQRSEINPGFPLLHASHSSTLADRPTVRPTDSPTDRPEWAQFHQQIRPPRSTGNATRPPSVLCAIGSGEESVSHPQHPTPRCRALTPTLARQLTARPISGRASQITEWPATRAGCEQNTQPGLVQREPVWSGCGLAGCLPCLQSN